jgi:hypothetical protein
MPDAVFQTPYPSYVSPADAAVIEAMIELLWAAVEATKADGTSVTRNAEEAVATRKFFAALGYGRRHVKELYALLEPRLT